jgi:RNA polymerase sigma factor (sigma-70 family)
MSDSVYEELLRQAMAGDMEALHVLLAMLYPDIRKWVSSVWSVRNDAERGVEDFVQETVKSVWEAFPTFKTPSFIAFRSWVQQIAHNHIRNAVRALNTQKRRHARQDVDEEGQMLVDFFARHSKSPRSFLGDRELIELLHASINAMPEPAQKIIRWRLLDGEEFKTIAERVGKSPEAVKMQFHRDLRLIRFVLGGFFNSRSGDM